MDLFPTVPVEVETKKSIFITEKRMGGRKTVIKSGAIRHYSLEFRYRDQDEFLEKLGEWQTNYPSIAFSWTNTDLNANGLFYFDSELKSVVENPNTFTYSFSVRSKDYLTASDPLTTVFPYTPNFAYDITASRKVLVSESIGLARVAAATSGAIRQFQYTFKNRSLAETIAAENFWNFHYPQTIITFSDGTFDEDMTFWFDSNFKWTVNGVNLIDYTFVFTEVL